MGSDSIEQKAIQQAIETLVAAFKSDKKIFLRIQNPKLISDLALDLSLTQADQWQLGQQATPCVEIVRNGRLILTIAFDLNDKQRHLLKQPWVIIDPKQLLDINGCFHLDAILYKGIIEQMDLC